MSNCVGLCRTLVFHLQTQARIINTATLPTIPKNYYVIRDTVGTPYLFIFNPPINDITLSPKITSMQASLEFYICQHCKEPLLSFDDAPNHNCFIGKYVYLSDCGQILYTKDAEIDEQIDDIQEISDEELAEQRVPGSIENFQTSQQFYVCQHCKEPILSFDDVPNHNCFIGKEVYLSTCGQILFTKDDEIDQRTNNIQEIPVEEFSKGSSMSNESPSQRVCESVQQVQKKQTYLWTRQSTDMLLSIWEAHIKRNVKMGAKSTAWASIAKDLETFDIHVSSNQVRWKINAILGKHKECVDNNRRSGATYKTFEFFDRVDDILRKERNCAEPYTLSSALPVNLKKPTTSSIQINSLKRSKPEKPEKTVKSPHGTGSKNAKKKIELENQWCQYMRRSEERATLDQEKQEKYFKIKAEENLLKEKYLKLREQEMKQKTELALKKLKSNDERHNEKIQLEKMKCHLLQAIANKKKNKSDENSD